MNPPLTVIIPVIKTRYFREALDSVLSQGVENLEVVVIDNKADADLTWVAEYPGVKLVRRSERMPLAANWADALTHATGEYVTFLSDDDYFESRSLLPLLAFLKAHPGPIVTLVGMRKVDEAGEFLHDSQPGKEEERLFELLFQYYGNGRDIGMNLVFHRARFLELGGFLEIPGRGLWIDVLTCFKCARHAPVGNFNGRVLNYRINPAGVSNSTVLEQLVDFNEIHKREALQAIAEASSHPDEATALEAAARAAFSKMDNTLILAAVAARSFPTLRKIFRTVRPRRRENVAVILDIALFLISRAFRKATGVKTRLGIRF